MMIHGFYSNKVSKSLKFSEEKTNLFPLVSHVQGHEIWVKIRTFYQDESTHLCEF